jgi:hypothetical protein
MAPQRNAFRYNESNLYNNRDRVARCTPQALELHIFSLNEPCWELYLGHPRPTGACAAGRGHVGSRVALQETILNG